MTRLKSFVSVSAAAGFSCVLFVAEAFAATFDFNQFEYEFLHIKSDGLYGTQEPYESGKSGRLRDDNLSGSGVDESYTIPPPPPVVTTRKHLYVYSSPGGTKFSATAEAPVVGVDPERGVNIGGVAQMKIIQAFNKTSPDAKLSFTIDAAHLSAFGGPNGPPGHLSASIVYETNLFTPLGPVDAFDTTVTLSGKPEDWELTNEGPLATEIKNGGLDELGILIELSSPYSQELDLSSVDVGTQVFFTYTITASAYDTYQWDSRIQAFGRDPLSLDSGLTLESSGLTPVPLPASLGLLGSALGVAFAQTYRRRRSRRAA